MRKQLFTLSLLAAFLGCEASTPPPAKNDVADDVLEGPADSDTEMADQKFDDFITDFNYEHELLFVDAPADAVGPAYAEIVGKPLITDVEIVDWSSDGFGANGVALGIGDKTMVYHRLGGYDGFDSARLSTMLDAAVFEFGAENTSGSRFIKAHVPGQSPTVYQEAANAEADAELYETMGGKPPKTEVIEDYTAFLESKGFEPVKAMMDRSMTVVRLGPRKEKVTSVTRVAVE